MRRAFVQVVFAFSLLTAAGCDRVRRLERITVTSTARVCEHTCRYLVFTTGTTYQNVDSPFEGKTDSSDLQGHLVPGRTYRISAIGRRSPQWSQYPNILAILGEGGPPVPVRYPSR